MQQQLIRPDYIFEVSWEVCNKVGGIHTVIATKTLTLVEEWEDNYILIGPDVWKGTGEHPEFAEDPELLKGWKEHALKCGFKVRAGRWKITGNPLVLLVDFTYLFKDKNDIFKNLWLDFQVDSLTGQWDYIEPALFGYAAGQLIECFYHYHISFSEHVVANFHEWMSAAGILYLKNKVPQAGTVFTTHATVIGRAIAGNELPLYSRLEIYQGDQEARKWNIIAKHSLEKAGAKYADCFTTVSELTGRECKQFLKRSPDLITPNGFDDTIVPDTYLLKQKISSARKRLLLVARSLTGTKIDDNSLLVLKSGRYEFRNKGLDVFIEGMGKLNKEKKTAREIVAFICIPASHTGPVGKLQDRINGEQGSGELENKFLTHHLQAADSDPIMQQILRSGLENRPEDRVKIIFAPVYLDGRDGIFNLSYYDLLAGFDISAFPSYYEPWGYTPLESLAFHVPTITTDATGFGQFIKDFNTGVHILHRDDKNDQEIVEQLVSVIKKQLSKTSADVEKGKEAAFSLSKLALWKKMIIRYKEAYSQALEKTKERAHLFKHEPQVTPLVFSPGRSRLSNYPVWRKIFIQPTYPKELESLKMLSQNLWWSWNQEAIELFASVSPELWERSCKNPIKMLDSLPLVRLKQLQRDTIFLNRLKNLQRTFEDYLAEKPEASQPQVAYFCMEYGLDNNLKLYSGGLGILAGDMLKEASDANKNMIGIGLLYRKGYFSQQLSLHGEQLANEDLQKFTLLPLQPLRNKEGEWLKINIAFPGRTLYAKAWVVPVGKIRLYLLDTDIPENRKEDRLITGQLYSGSTEQRLKQELLLGIGGVRLLHSMNIHPDVYHCNEGHAAFLGLERLYTIILENNIPYPTAMEAVRASTLFTTHTPVKAGHDRFSEDILRVYLSKYIEIFNISWEQLMALGRKEDYKQGEKFSMSYLASRIAQEINGVSQIHREISRKLFNSLWESFTSDELHIGYITNGIHYATWVAAEWHALYQKELGPAPEKHLTDHVYWEKILEIDDNLLWQTHQNVKKKLISFVRNKIETDMTAHHENPALIARQLQYLDESALIIGFARRMVTYKRASLVLHNTERLSKLLSEAAGPVIILFAGKAHPHDPEGQEVIRQIITASRQEEFIGRIIYLENYDMELGKLLVQGVDLWLNTPVRGMEASGTSGMKSALNGGLNFSVLDGWWREAYDERCGWAIEDNPYNNTEFSKEIDAEALYLVLENKIIPDFFEQKNNLPLKWTEKMKHSIANIVPWFNTARMLKEYYDLYYSGLAKRAQLLREDHFKKAGDLSEWKRKVQEAWPRLRVESINVFDSSDKSLPLGEHYIAEIEIYTDQLSADELGVEIVFIEKRQNDEQGDIIFKQELEVKDKDDRVICCSCKIPMTRSGVFEYGFRFYPKHPLLPHRQDFPLINWI